MLVVVEYISEIKIEDTVVPVYVTDDSRMYVGMEIMPYLRTPNQVKQTIIMDKDAMQYSAYPILEVCKFVKKKKLLSLDTSSIYKKRHAIIDIEPKTLIQQNGGTKSNPITPEDEFAITLRRMLTSKKKK